MYIEELKDSRISYKDTPELMWLLLDFSCSSPTLFQQYKVRNVFCFFHFVWKILLYYEFYCFLLYLPSLYGLYSSQSLDMIISLTAYFS